MHICLKSFLYFINCAQKLNKQVYEIPRAELDGPKAQRICETSLKAIRNKENLLLFFFLIPFFVK